MLMLHNLNELVASGMQLSKPEFTIRKLKYRMIFYSLKFSRGSNELSEFSISRMHYNIACDHYGMVN